MQKVYLLLRNNQQAGPYTLEELLAIGVKPTDLIWVEGKSAAWRYPGEIKELQPSAPPANTDKETQKDEINKTVAASEKKESITIGKKKIFVSLPFQARKPVEPQPLSSEELLEQKAEALRQRLQAYTPPTENEKPKAQLETGYSRSLSEVEETFTNWQLAKNRKKRRFNKQHAFAALIGAVVISIPLYFLATSKSTPTPEVETVTKTGNINKPEANEAVSQVTYYSEESDGSIKEENITKAASKESKKATVRKADTNTLGVEKTNNGFIAQNDKNVNTDSAHDVEDAEPEIKEATTAKKKTLGEAIDGFFGKFKKDKKEPTGTAGTTAGTDGVRRASKRNEAATEEQPPAPEQLAEQVTITASEPAENWMLGIKGLKLTLHNQSDYKLSNASVEVAYFDEQNTLLEKKTVLFKNVPANKSATLAAPDHRLATYAKHQLLTVSGE